MNDLLGTALLDYHQHNPWEDLLTETNISEEDLLPLPYFFRSYEEMPAIEQQALKLAKGRVLDVGCAAGSHSLYLQNQGLEITAIDISSGAVQVARERGVKQVYQQSLLEATERYDTILLLMNGTGIFGRLAQVHQNLTHLKSLLAPKGQILIDSSDLQYMYDVTEEGGILVPADRYYGELDFTMHYKGQSTEVFPWLYLDEAIFEAACQAAGLDFEVVARGENYDYLAHLSGRD